MLKILILVLCTNLVLTKCGPQQTMINQGKRLCCYYDVSGIATIGIAFQLKRNDAATAMANYNLTVSNVVSDCERNTTKYCLTNDQAEDLFHRILYPEASTCVDKYVPNLPKITRAAVIDVAFAGCQALNTFVHMKNALEMHDWKLAAEELQNSLWCEQVKQRCNLNYNCILNEPYSDQLYVSTINNCSLNSQCYYYKTLNGKSFSTSKIQCSHFLNCTHCSSSTSVCIMNPCCIEPICIPLSLNETCTVDSTTSLYSLNLQSNFNGLLETISRKLNIFIILFSLLLLMHLFLFLIIFIKF